jgi:PAS domain S-box-containing protein
MNINSIDNLIKLYESLYENSNDSIVLYDTRGKILKHNEKFNKLLQKEKYELINESIYDFIDNENQTLFTEQIERLKKENTTSFECDIYIKEQKIPIKISSNLIDLGDMIIIQSVIKNLTKLKQSLADIEKKDMTIQMSQDKLLEAQKIAKVGNWELDFTTDKLIWSDEVFKIFDLDPHTFKANYEAFLDAIHPDDVEQVNHEYMTSVLTKIPYTIEHRIITKNGTLKYVEENCKHITDDKGNIIRSLGTVQDITARKNAEIKLEKTEKHYQSILENMEDIYLRFDLDGKILTLMGGAKKNLDYLPIELINTNIKNLYKDPSSYQNLMENLERNGGKSRVVIETLDKKKNPVWCSVNSQYWYNDDGSVGGVQCFSRNITQEIEAEKNEKLMNQRIQDQEEMILVQSKHSAMGEMIAIIAHQWRQPISIIGMLIHALQEGIKRDKITLKDIEQDLINISHQVTYMSQTIDDFRNFFKKSKAIQKISLLKLLNDSQSILTSLLRHHGINLKLNCSGQINLTTYSSDLMQIIVNIVSNAKDALISYPGEKNIVINAEEDDEIVKISIFNNHSHINDEVKNRIFEPYFTTKENQNGTGLGLYMVKTILDKHMQGKIAVENLSDGVEFTITLPKEIDSSN